MTKSALEKINEKLGSQVTANTTKALKVVKVIAIDLHEIVENPYQPRITYDLDTVKSIAADLDSKKAPYQGLLQPIGVIETDNGGYMMLYGHTRRQAHELTGLKKIYATVHEVSPIEVMTIPYKENQKRMDLNRVEEAEYLQKVKDSGEFSNDSLLCEELHITNSHLSKMLKIAKLPESVKKMIRETQYTNKNVLYGIAGLDEEQEQLDVLRGIAENKLTQTEAETAVKTAKRKNLIGEDEPLSKTKKSKFDEGIKLNDWGHITLNKSHAMMKINLGAISPEMENLIKTFDKNFKTLANKLSN